MSRKQTYKILRKNSTMPPLLQVEAQTGGLQDKKKQVCTFCAESHHFSKYPGDRPVFFLRRPHHPLRGNGKKEPRKTVIMRFVKRTLPKFLPQLMDTYMKDYDDVRCSEKSYYHHITNYTLSSLGRKLPQDLEGSNKELDCWVAK